jgi:hypothetical protein
MGCRRNLFGTLCGALVATGAATAGPPGTASADNKCPGGRKREVPGRQGAEGWNGKPTR